MNMQEICPCVNIDCPNHGNCENCTSRHLRKGSLNYCGFYTVLPELQGAIKASPDSPTSQKLAAMIDNRLETYAKLTAKHGLTEKGQEQLLKKVADYSAY
jgi:hypothetical protein